MFCKNCGYNNPDPSKFCRNCGTPMAAAPPPSAGNPPLDAGNATASTGYQPPSTGYTPPSAGYQPPSAGYTPPNMGYPPPPPKKKSKAGIIVGLSILAVLLFTLPILILTSLNPPKTDPTDPGTSGNVVLGDPSDNGNTPAPTTASPDSGIVRDNYTQIYGDGTDVATVMIYICGADLESDGGFGSIDINEILAATLGTNVNVVIETGGCTDWYIDGIADGQVQRWLVQDGQLWELENRGAIGMLNAEELSDFINFASYNYPANRYELILWDHGGGSLYGYGSDELYPDSTLFLQNIAAALAATNIKFDIVGFDACLMGTIETAYMLEPFADYLVASEETEPAYGWYYTPWLSALGANTGIGTVELGTAIVDSFIEQNAEAQEYGMESTLSVVELREVPHVYEMLCEYMPDTSASLAEQQFQLISTAVANTKSFADASYDLIDIVDFANNSGMDGQQELISAISTAVKYSDSTLRSGVYGLSMYFPYTGLMEYEYAKDFFSQFGFGDEIYAFYDVFVNYLAGGQQSSTSRSLMETMTGEEQAGTDYSVYDWYDNSTIDSYTYDSIDYTELEILYDDVSETWYLPLSDEDWELITAVEMQILLDDGTGYVDLGSDQYFETDDYGNLLLNFGRDYTWVAIDGQVVCYYAEAIVETQNDKIYRGYVPAVLNNNDYIEIILEWSDATGESYIAGYRLAESNSTIGGAGTVGKGYMQFETGDMVDYVCDFYTYDGEYDDVYYYGDTLYIGSTLPAVTYEDVGDYNTLECYMIVDIYQNYSWTEYVEFTVY